MDFEDYVLDKKSNDVDYYELREWADDIEEIRTILKKININTSHIICYFFWKWWSLKMDAGWLSFGEREVIRVANEINKYV